MLSSEQLGTISDLIGKYEALPPAERRRYQETEVRTNFIDDLFAALGWRMGDREHVERETTITDAKRPDYIFKLNGVPHLFLEAKRFTEDPRAEQWARDAITKAYNKGVGWAAVTNFADLVVYDAYELLVKTSRPRKVLDLHYLRYPAPDSPLYELSPESLMERSMERRAQEAGIRTKTIPIERRLYESMREWREKLINSMAQYQDWRTDQDYAMADEAVQRLIDRLLFLRHCEDRGIIRPELRSLLNRIRERGRRNVQVTDSLLRLFADAANTFDSEIFQTDALIDIQFRSLAHITDFDELLADIIRGLYVVPRSLAEYDFSQMDADVLGQVYEQYLGHVAQQTKKFLTLQAAFAETPPAVSVEAKRQRRREHGIYYTPAWVVRYIVEQTLGRFLEENGERHDAIRRLSILDPACGSGSFLIRAYETLLDYYAKQMGGEIPDTATRYRVLRDHIYGVDIDSQAVEIARLNLLIRMVQQQERLPELKDNIQYGNSLIEGDGAALGPFFGDAWETKHPFDWRQRFPQVMEYGGFDVVIGNPPYVTSALVTPPERDYHRAKFHTATGKYDLYMLFTERALSLTKDGGYASFIMPNKFMHTSAGSSLRQLLSRENDILEIMNFDDNPVFAGVTNYPCVLVMRKGATKTHRRIHYTYARDSSRAAWQWIGIPTGQLGAGIWMLSTQPATGLIGRLLAKHPTVEEVGSKIATGIQTGADSVLLISDPGVKGLDRRLFRPILRGRDVKRYALPSPTHHVFFPFHVKGSTCQIMAETELARFEATWEYLRRNEERLRKRIWYGKSAEQLTGAWYGLMYLGQPEWYAKPKIITPALSATCNFTLDYDGLLFVTGTAGAYGLTLERPFDTIDGHLYALTVLNSAVTQYCIRMLSPLFSGGFYKFNTQYLKRLPFPARGPSDPVVRQLATLGRRMLDLRGSLQRDVRTFEREIVEHEIADVGCKIDEMVFDLYSLSQKERALVESELTPPK